MTVEIARCSRCGTTKLGGHGRRPVLLEGHGVLCWDCANGMGPAVPRTEPGTPATVGVLITIDEQGIGWRLAPAGR